MDDKAHQVGSSLDELWLFFLEYIKSIKAQRQPAEKAQAKK